VIGRGGVSSPSLNQAVEFFYRATATRSRVNRFTRSRALNSDGVVTACQGQRITCRRVWARPRTAAANDQRGQNARIGVAFEARRPTAQCRPRVRGRSRDARLMRLRTVIGLTTTWKKERASKSCGRGFFILSPDSRRRLMIMGLGLLAAGREPPACRGRAAGPGACGSPGLRERESLVQV